MKKILLTNNLNVIDLTHNKYDKVYTDSPYVIEYYKDAIYLDTLLDKSIHENIENIRKKGFEINKDIINIFFPKYKDRNINIISVGTDFTNIYINTVKLFKLMELYPNDEIIIGITNDELYNNNSPEVLSGIRNRFANIYYWIADLVNLKNVYLRIITNNEKEVFKKQEQKKFQNIGDKSYLKGFSLGHQTMDSWFLRLADLDKKVIFFNFLKKINLINKNKKNLTWLICQLSSLIIKIQIMLLDMKN